jgi:hypothetical protein
MVYAGMGRRESEYSIDMAQHFIDACSLHIDLTFKIPSDEWWSQCTEDETRYKSNVEAVLSRRTKTQNLVDPAHVRVNCIGDEVEWGETRSWGSWESELGPFIKQAIRIPKSRKSSRLI